MSEWIDIKQKLPVTEIEENKKGSYYFSRPILVKRGKRTWRAIYKPSKGQFFTWPKRYSSSAPTDITDYVKYWRYE